MSETPVSRSPEAAARGKRKLRIWEVTALSVGFMGPVMAMALNGIGVAGLVGTSVPFTFALAFIGTLLVGYGFIRLTGYFTHAGSVYALAGATIGPRAGFFGGFALLGTYLFFAACILGATGVFFEAWAEQFGGGLRAVPWILVALVVSVLVVALNIRESRIVTRVLFVIGSLGVLAMVVLAAVIFWQVGTGTGPVEAATIDWSTFLPGDASGTAVLTASVFAFLSWAGFESGASLGEETENPRRVIPRALLGAIVVAGLLYVVMMFAQTIGYGTDAPGVAAFAGANSTLTELSTLYIGREYALLIAFIAFVVAFASVLSSTAAAARLIYALARDGFGPKRLGVANPRTGVPTAAVLTTIVLALALAGGIAAFGGSAFDAYYWYATIATLCMVVAYGMTSVGVIVHVFRGRTRIPKWEAILPVLGLLYLACVYAVQVIGQSAPYTYFPWIAGAWCLVGLVIILARPKLAERIGGRLSVEDLD
ncbi:APC family permease [Leucobacter zeae]|nr:APC family permease [Leucobacter zeae]